MTLEWKEIYAYHLPTLIALQDTHLFSILEEKKCVFQCCFILFSSLYRKNATQSVPCVDSSKYLGQVIDSKLNFDKNCAECIKDAPETSLSERILLYFHKTSKISFYWAFTTLILSLSLVSGFGSLSVKNRNSLHHIVKWSSKPMGESQLNPTRLCTGLLQRIAASIWVSASPFWARG